MTFHIKVIVLSLLEVCSFFIGVADEESSYLPFTTSSCWWHQRPCTIILQCFGRIVPKPLSDMSILAHILHLVEFLLTLC